MSNDNGKYTPDEETEETTQVRSIIRHLNEDRPSKERKREVVVRPDGSKVVRVTKRRRKMVTEREKRHRSNRSFILSLSGVFIVLCALIAFFLYRMVSMTGEAYIQSRTEEVCRAWGASSVRIVGEGLDGTTLHLSSVVAEFPEDSIIESVELSGLEAELIAAAFFNNELRADKLSIKNAIIRLRGDKDVFRMPRMGGKALWLVNRVECDSLTVSWGERESAPLAFTDCRAYMYYPRAGRDNCVVVMKSGQMRVRNWYPIRILDSKIHLSPVAVEDFYLRGTVDAESASAESSRTAISFRGRMGENDSLGGPYPMQAENMPFADFTGGRFEEFFTARTGSEPQKELLSRMMVTPEGPRFSGGFELSKIIVTSMPAITTMLEHIEPLKRRQYLPPTILQGYVSLDATEDTVTLELPENRVVEPYKFAVRGKFSVNKANELTGELSYGMPGLLTRAEYPDGMSDPLFRDQGEWAWLSTELRGFANRPADNIDELEKAAVEQRKSRPAPFSFDTMDINKMSEAVKDGKDVFGDQPAESSSSPFEAEGEKDPFAEPKTGDNPFAPLNPF